MIIASKLIISVPPLLSNLAGFDLSIDEWSLFQEWVTGAYYASLVSDTGIPDDVDITNVGADTAYNLPKGTCILFPPDETRKQSQSLNNHPPSPRRLRHRPNPHPWPQEYKLRLHHSPSLRRRRPILHSRLYPTHKDCRRHDSQHHILQPQVRRFQQPHAVRTARVERCD